MKHLEVKVNINGEMSLALYDITNKFDVISPFSIKEYFKSLTKEKETEYPFDLVVLPYTSGMVEQDHVKIEFNYPEPYYTTNVYLAKNIGRFVFSPGLRESLFIIKDTANWIEAFKKVGFEVDEEQASNLIAYNQNKPIDTVSMQGLLMEVCNVQKSNEVYHNFGMTSIIQDRLLTRFYNNPTKFIVDKYDIQKKGAPIVKEEVKAPNETVDVNKIINSLKTVRTDFSSGVKTRAVVDIILDIATSNVNLAAYILYFALAGKDDYDTRSTVQSIRNMYHNVPNGVMDILQEKASALQAVTKYGNNNMSYTYNKPKGKEFEVAEEIKASLPSDIEFDLTVERYAHKKYMEINNTITIYGLNKLITLSL